MVTIALDATYACYPERTGTGIYSEKLIAALGRLVAERQAARARIVLGVRPGPLVKWAWKKSWPDDFRIAPLLDRGLTMPRAELFHGLNQRLPARPYPLQVITLHERYPAPSEDYSAAPFRAHMGQRIERALRQADRVIVVSHSVREHLSEHRPELASKLRVIHHGVDPAPVIDERDRDERDRLSFLSRRLGLGPQDHFFLNVGAVQIRKNLKNLVQALRPLDGVPLIVAGNDGYGAAEIRDWIRQSGMQNRVHLIGHAQPGELRYLYSSATALVFPSLEEAFGLPILEAMSYGCPVITANGSAMPEVAGDAALLIDPHDVEGISAAMRQVLSDPALAASLRERGLRRAAAFSWEKCARETWSVYQELLEN